MELAALKLVMILLLADGTRVIAPTNLAECAEWAGQVSAGQQPWVDNADGKPQPVVVALCVPEAAERMARAGR